MSHSVAMVSEVAETLAGHLIRRDGQEDLCFALYRPSVGATRTTALLETVLLPEDGDRIVKGNVEFRSQYFERAIATARRAGAGLALLHSHPFGGWQPLSPQDEISESAIAGPIQAATQAPFVGATISNDRIFSARVWERIQPRTYTPMWCESVRVLGDGLTLHFADSVRPRPRSRPQFARTVAAWGEDAHAMLTRTRVGIAGLGSVGSIVSESLARIGFEQIELLDFDSLDDVNLDRTLNAYDTDVGLPKVSVAARAARRSATSSIFGAREHEYSVCEDEGYRRMLDCDVVFSCVDRPWPRSILNFIAYAHLIPIIDGGIHVSRTRSGKMRGAEWKAHIAMPGRRCLACLGQYDPGLVQAEREGHLDDPHYIESLPDEHPVKRNENVFAFSLGAASLELMQLISLIVGPAGVHNYGAQTYHATTGSLDLSHSACKPWCPLLKLVARGQSAGAAGTSRHAAAEHARERRHRRVARA